MKRNYVSIMILVFVFSLVSYAAIFGFGDYNNVKYYQTFRYVTTDNQHKSIYYLNEMTKKQTKNNWYVKVYFDRNGNWIKFDNFNKDGNLLQTINNNVFAGIKNQTKAITLKK